MLSCRVVVWLNRVENDEEVNYFVGKRMWLFVMICVLSENEVRGYNIDWFFLWFLIEYGGLWWGK